MNVEAVKIELFQLILDADNPTVLQRVKDVFKPTEYTLTDEQVNAEIKLAKKLLSEGKRISWEDFKKKHYK